MPQRDHHDWASEAYVDEWVRRQQAEDPTRADRFELICDLLSFPADAPVTILDIGAGYGPLSKVILDRYPRASCIGQDGSEPMLERARQLMGRYGERFKTHHSDLFDRNWPPTQFRPFDAAVSSSCLHNLRDFTRIREIYGEVREHLKAGGVFLNLDLVNAPTPGLERRYVAVAALRRQREGGAREDVAAMVGHGDHSSMTGTTGPFSADLDQHLAALRAAGFNNVDCFWKDLRRALFGGHA